MCGRFNLTSPLEDIIQTFGLDELGAQVNLGNIKPSYNIAPGQDIPIIRSVETGKDVLSAYAMETLLDGKTIWAEKNLAQI